MKVKVSEGLNDMDLKSERLEGRKVAFSPFFHVIQIEVS